MDFIMGVFTDKCTGIGIKFLQLKNINPESATLSKRTTVGQHLDWVGYAYDPVLLFEDITNLELALSILSATLKRYHLEINISKTKMMIFNHQYINEEHPKSVASKINTPVENTTIFKYLRY